MEGYQSVASPKTRALDCDWPLAYCSWGRLFKGAGSICSLGPKVAPSLLLLAEQGGQVSRQSHVGFGSHPHAPPRVNASAPFRHVCLRWEGPLRKADHRQKGEMLDSQEDGPLKAFELIWSRRLDCSLPCATLVCKLSSRHAQTPTAFVGSFPWKPPEQISGACKKKKQKKADDVAAARLSYNSVWHFKCLTEREGLSRKPVIKLGRGLPGTGRGRVSWLTSRTPAGAWWEMWKLALV